MLQNLIQEQSMCKDQLGSDDTSSRLSLSFRIRKVPLSNLSPETNYASRGFTQFLKQITGIIPQTTSQQLPSTYPSFHCSLMTPSLDATWYKLLTVVKQTTDRQLRSSFYRLGLLDADAEELRSL